MLSMNRASPAVTQVLRVGGSPLWTEASVWALCLHFPLSEAVKHHCLKYVSLAYLNWPHFEKTHSDRSPLLPFGGGRGWTFLLIYSPHLWISSFFVPAICATIIVLLHTKWLPAQRAALNLPSWSIMDCLSCKINRFRDLRLWNVFSGSSLCDL